ncbi:MAG: cytochrome c [Pseudomonadales bacterium]
MSRLSSDGKMLLGLAILTCTSALGSEGDVDYRHHSMEAIGGHMQAIVKILRQEVPHSGHLSLHANAIADMARVAPDLFPEGSEGGEALPVIWEQPEDFAKRLDTFHSAAETFKDAAESGDPASIGDAIGGLGQACKGCHDNYREE